tara:strand:+ start:16573 stop:16818 length:246 start_codon:yes stop_codon:yes gene_type:complete
MFEQNKMKYSVEEYKKLLNGLLTVQSNMDEITMGLIFGVRVGDHLYQKFERYGRNVVYFFSSLDEENKITFLKYVDQILQR